MSGWMTRRHGLQALAGASLLGWGAPRPAWAHGAAAERRASPSPRLVSVHSSLTETIYRLGAQDTLVGTDTTSTFPEAAQHTRKVGYMRTLSAEGLLALQPTAVLATDEAGPPVVLAQVRQAGVPVHLVPSTLRFDDVLAKVRLVAQLTGREAQGRALVAELQAEWQAVQARQPSERPQATPRVMFVMAHGGGAMTAGRDTSAHAMLQLAGARNALEQVQGFRALNAESVVLAQPDVVLTTTESLAFLGGPARLWQQAGLSHTPAARRQRLLAFDGMALLGFGPRMPAVLNQLQRQLA
ncbi:MAG: hemin ABC transporter substrate-binding protein [Aquabacterium sp.]